MPGPMEGVRVVELGVWIAGPAAGGVLADWGADVVKIEPPEGDPARGFGAMMGDDLPTNPVFELDNRGKRSIVLDLTTPEGLEVALELLDAADVFVTNVRALGPAPPRPRRRDAAGPQPPADLRPHQRLRPRGPRRRQGGVRHRRVLGARRHRPPAHAARRHAAVPARRHGRPQHRLDVRRRHRAALFNRERTGKGQLVTSSLYRQGVYTVGLRPQHHARLGPPPGDRAPRDDGQPVGQQLLGRRRSPLLDRRARRRPPLAADRPHRRPPGVDRRPPLRSPRSTGRRTPPS